MHNQRELSVKRMKDGVDRISELPDSLKESILDCLPIKDAVRTSILSSEWRYTWTFRKQLDFNQIFFRSIDIFAPEKYIRIIDRILVMHQGPIEYVSMCIPQGFWDDKIDLNSWLFNWSQKRIQELEINAFKHWRGVKFFPLPSCLFQCQSLRYLTLGRCALNPPDFGGFFNLVTLRLRKVRVSSDFLGTFISRCTQLENLYIRFSYPDLLNRSKPLIIDAPNLRNLELWDTPGTIVLQNVPLLNALSLQNKSDMHFYTHTHLSSMYSSFNLLSSLGKIEKLDCDPSLLEHLNGDCPDPDKLPVLLTNLKTLRINFFRVFKREEIASIFCLLRSAPSLKTLHIQICKESIYPRKAFEDSLECLEVEGRKANNFKKLMTINVVLIREWYPWKPMLKFIKILLCSCPALKTLSVAPNSEKELDAVKVEWVTKLLQCYPLSSNAKITVCGYVHNGHGIRCVDCQARQRRDYIQLCSTLGCH